MTSRREGPVPLDHRRAPRPVGRGSDRRPRPGLQCEARRGSVGGRGPDAPPRLPPPRGNPGGPQDSGRAGRDLLARPDGQAGHGSRRSGSLRIRKGLRRPSTRILGASVPRSPDEATTMAESLPVVYLARHGETAWSLSGQHTGRTDLPLTERGERDARSLGERLRGLTFATVLTSPLRRAARTCELAGFGADAEIDRDLLEWDYGRYEGRTSAEIQAERPGWQLFRDGCPGGESPEQVGVRAERLVNRVRAIRGDLLLFSSGHFLR